MPTHNHFPNLIAAMRAEWELRPDVLCNFALRNDGNRYWTVESVDWRRVSTWECRPFPGCSALITTTQFQVYDPFKEQGIGRALRTLMHAAYKRAGFSGEIATVRADNVAMQAFMSGRVIDEFPSDFGGTFKLWMTRFDVSVAQVQPAPFTGTNVRPPAFVAPPVFTPPPAPRVPYTYNYTPPNPVFTRVVTPPQPPATPPPEANRAEPGENPGPKKEKLYAHWPD